MSEAPPPPPAVKKPYSTFFHPLKSWLDIFVGYILTWIVPLSPLANLPAYEDGNTTTAANAKIRRQFETGAPSMCKPFIVKWSKAFDDHVDNIVQVTLNIPRRPNILQEWKILNKGNTNTAIREDEKSEAIPVILRLPLSACGAEDRALASTGTNEFGCKTLETINLAALDSKASFCIWFHGGGLTLGTMHDSDGLHLAQSASADGGKPLILASVGYSLAPTHVFPTAISESLTVLSYFMDQMPQRHFHIAGMSAGGNLGSVAALELFRLKADKLGSLLALVPMVDPAADSDSYYMNHTSSFAATDWLRWCWRCYLALPPNETERKVDIYTLPTMAQRYAHGPNQTSWKESPWRKAALDRLVDPTLDLPPNLGAENDPPMVVLTNQGDPLHDDGIKLYEALKAKGAKVQHLDHRGSHWFGTALDTKNFQQVVDVWKEMLFPTT
eukprot:scaffold4917_cov172-Amphora_coffeaeformis.AAC.1